MHIISNERALAHWQALYRLPIFAAELLRERFIREQPRLAATLLTLTGGTYADADGKLVIATEGDPKREEFQRISLTAALLAEVMRREAKRPLRKLEAAEVSALMETNLDLFRKFKQADETGSKTPPEIFVSCAQRYLLCGVFIATKDEPSLPREKMVLECYLLRLVIEGLHLACGGEAERSCRCGRPRGVGGRLALNWRGVAKSGGKPRSVRSHWASVSCEWLLGL